MRQSAQLLGLTALAGLMLPLPAAVAQGQSAPPPPAETVLLQTAGSLETGDVVLNDGSLYDVYRIEGKAGQTLAITLESLAFDAFLLLRDDQGNELARNDDIDANAGNYHAFIAATLPADGIYEIWANGIDETARGDYRLSAVVTMPGQAVPALSADAIAQTEANRLLDQGAQQFGVSQFQAALQSWQQALAIYVEIGDRQGEANVLGNLGSAYRRLGQYERALDFHQRSLAVRQLIGDRRGQASSLGSIGLAYYSLNQFERALDFYQQALALSDRRQQGGTLGNLGLVYDGLGQYEQAIDFYQQSLAIYQEIGDLQGRANTLGNLGNAYNALGQYERALDFHQQSLAGAREVGDRWLAAIALNDLGNIYQSLGQPEQAIEALQQALVINQEIGARQGEAAALGNLGNVYSALGQYERAIDFHQQALAITRETGSRQGQASSLGNLGNAYAALSQYERAIDFYQQQLTTVQQIGFRLGEANALASLGLTYDALGQHEQAVEVHQRSLAIAQDIGFRQGEANALRNLGVAYNALGQYERAIDLHQRSLAIAQDIGDRQDEANALSTLGLVYFFLGQYERAADFHQQSLVINREIGFRQGEAAALSNLGLAYRELGQYERAVDFHQQALAIARQIGSQQGQAASLGNLGLAYAALEEYERAIDFHQQSLAIKREIGDRRGQANSLGNLGLAYNALGQHERAIDFHQQSLAIKREIGDLEGEANSLSSLGRSVARLEQPALAIVFLKASVQVREAIRGGLRGLETDLQQSYTNTVADDYRFLADLLLGQGRIPEAQQVLDLLKLEELSEFTQTERASWVGRQLVYSDAEQAVIDAHGSLMALGSEVTSCEAAGCPQQEALYAQLEALKQQYNQAVAKFEATVRASRGVDEIFQVPSNISRDAEALLAAYTAEGQTAALIYPFVLEDKLWLVWAAAGSVVGSVEVPVTQRQLAETVQRFGQQLKAPHSGTLAELQASSQALYSWIIEPLETELARNGIEHLVFVNDRVTRYIPMAALYDGEQFLLERYTVSTVLAPALTDAETRFSDIDQAQVLGLGLTEAVAGYGALPAVAEELEAIVRGQQSDRAGIYPGQVLLDRAFTLDSLKTNVANFQVLHLATHAAFVPGRADESYILLGDGQPLKVADIEVMERRLRNLHMVVLSACQTALGGAAGDGTEIAGISSYFLGTGRAKTVVASLWAVNDSSTSLLMQRFYELLASGELSKAEALRQAQLSLLYDQDSQARLAAARAGIVVERSGSAEAVVGFQHPYHWAPFILIGNGL